MSQLDFEEKEILKSFEKGEWESVGDSDRLEQLQSYAKANLAKDKQITLRLSSLDLNAIEEILLLPECSLEGEWEGQVRFLPLR